MKAIILFVSLLIFTNTEILHCVKLITVDNIDKNMRPPNRMTLLRTAIDKLDIEKVKSAVKILHKKNISLNSVDEFCQTPLVRLLTDIDADNVNKVLNILNYLIQSGADPNFKSKDEPSPLSAVARSHMNWTPERSVVIQALLNLGAKVRTDNKNYFNIFLNKIFECAALDDIEFIKNIIYYDSDKLNEQLVVEYINAIPILRNTIEKAKNIPNNQYGEQLIAKLEKAIDLIIKSIQIYKSKPHLEQNLPKELNNIVTGYIGKPDINKLH